MEAVIVSGGKQYRVREGDLVRLERLPSARAPRWSSARWRTFGAKGTRWSTRAQLGAARVVGQVVRIGRAKKIVVGKFKRRKNYRRRQGHRQAFTQVRITRIDAGA